MHALLRKLPRRVRTRSILWAVGVWFASLLLAGLFTVGRRPAAQLLQLEFLVYLAMLLAAAMLPVVRRFVSRIPQPHRWGYALLLTALLTGQIAGEDRGLFPLVRWHMYSKPLDPKNITATRYAGVTASGKRILLNPGTLYPSLGYGSLRLHNRLELLGKASIEMEHTEHAEEVQRRLQGMLCALARRHNQIAAHEKVVRVELWHARLNVRQKPAPAVQWRKTHTFEVYDHAIAAR